ncbi:hypothetical protein MT325_m678R [Paramecium bursaria chlorella virus MT325]|uniref:Uncharacterized protein m678R n=1 Tax=Paramecium bursaria Chlorella virus MT325 TaxID=346932 RepID=A7IV58_PBCVM|nr:hypothetical protein MT325_m678R [Paramecium bursaria chlorella virus MT325]
MLVSCLTTLNGSLVSLPSLTRCWCAPQRSGMTLPLSKQSSSLLCQVRKSQLPSSTRRHSCRSGTCQLCLLVMRCLGGQTLVVLSSVV